MLFIVLFIKHFLLQMRKRRKKLAHDFMLLCMWGQQRPSLRLLCACLCKLTQRTNGLLRLRRVPVCGVRFWVYLLRGVPQRSERPRPPSRHTRRLTQTHFQPSGVFLSPPLSPPAPLLGPHLQTSNVRRLEPERGGSLTVFTQETGKNQHLHTEHIIRLVNHRSVKWCFVAADQIRQKTSAETEDQLALSGKVWSQAVTGGLFHLFPTHQLSVLLSISVFSVCHAPHPGSAGARWTALITGCGWFTRPAAVKWSP